MSESTKLQLAVGFHANTPCFCDGIGDYLAKVAEAGHMISAKSVDSTASLMDYQQLRERGHDGIGIFRCLVWKNTDPPPGWEKNQDVPPYGHDPYATAVIYRDKLRAAFPPELKREYFYIEMINECDKNESDWLGYFMVELGKLLMEDGFKFAGPSWAGGEPEPEHNRTPGMLEWFRLIEQHPDDLAHSLHEYAWLRNTQHGLELKETIPFQMGRCIDVNHACLENGITPPPILITEFGWGADNAPSWHTGNPQIIKAGGMVEWYLQNVPNVKALQLWALDKNIKWGDLADVINPYMTPLSNNIIKREPWMQPAEIEEPDVPPIVDPPIEPPVEPPSEKPKIVILKLSQDHDGAAWSQASTFAYENYKRTITASHDDMLTMLKAGNKDISYAIVADPDRANQREAILALEADGYKYEVIYIADQEHRPIVDLFKWRPCDTDRVTQTFGANPQNYQKFGLPGHDGIDYGVGRDLPYYAVQDGEVVHASHMRPSGGESAWGYHVIIRHEVNNIIFHTVYAHAKRGLPVSKGDIVKAGKIVGYSGNTGNSFGYHLHFNLLWMTNPGNGFPKWTYGYAVDPWPYLQGKARPPVQPGLPKYNLLDYMRGDGRMYEVRHPAGNTETFQTQRGDTGVFYQVKNSQYETFAFDVGFIWRGIDTSPGKSPYAERPDENRYYNQAEPNKTMARWALRNMFVGQTYTGPGHYVQFYYKDRCVKSKVNTGPATNRVSLIAHHDQKTWNGITVKNVIVLQTNTGEKMYFAKNYGLVAWSSAWGESAICELHKGRPDLVRETGCFTI